MTQFKIGDKVRCINNTLNKPGFFEPPLKLHGIYIVQDIQVCTKCNAQHLDVGVISNAPPTSRAWCDCGSEMPRSHLYYGCAHRFVKEVEAQEIRYVAVKHEVKIEEPSLN